MSATALTVTELRAYPRNFLDTDDEELPDSIVDVWRHEGTNRIIKSSDKWSFYRASDTFDTVASTEEYPIVDIGTVDWDSIRALEGERWLLQKRSHEEMAERFAYSDNTGTPLYWSEWAGSVFLWPTPSDAETIKVRGYRNDVPTDVGGDEPDLPDEFHPLIAEWILARAYEFMDDEIISNQILSRWYEQLAELRKKYETPDRSGMIQMGGKKRGGVRGRLWYDWE